MAKFVKTPSPTRRTTFGLLTVAVLAAILMVALSAGPASARLEIGLSTPPLDDLHLEQGEHFEFDARVYNGDGSTENITFILTASGDFEGQVDFSPNDFELTPGTNRQVHTTIRIPWSWEPGETYEGMLTVTGHWYYQVNAQDTIIFVPSVSKRIRVTVGSGGEKPLGVVLDEFVCGVGEFIRENQWLLLCALPAVVLLLMHSHRREKH